MTWGLTMASTFFMPVLLSFGLRVGPRAERVQQRTLHAGHGLGVELPTLRVAYVEHVERQRLGGGDARRGDVDPLVREGAGERVDESGLVGRLHLDHGRDRRGFLV